MKKRAIEELKNKPVEELKRLLGENYEKLRKLKFDLASNKIKNIKEIEEIKRIIARILTFLNQYGKNK